MHNMIAIVVFACSPFCPSHIVVVHLEVDHLKQCIYYLSMSEQGHLIPL